MTEGSILLKLQDLDLQMMRDRASLENLPELKELAQQRKAYIQLKNEATRLYAIRKDIDTDLSDLHEQELLVHQDIESAHEDVDTTDYHAVQDLELRLTNLAKELDKITYTRAERKKSLADVEEQAKKLAEQLKSLEDAVKKGTLAARDHAASIQKEIARAERDREAYRSELGPAAYERYAAASKRFKGLAVERLNGNIPSICRTTLQPSSLDDLKHQGEVGECPYCHRILVSLEDAS